MDHLLMAGCLLGLGLVFTLAFLWACCSGATVRRRGRPDRMSDSWRFSQWRKDERTRWD